jgi:2-dehydro-3-deoxyphosphogluconate aldolase / (4S)-4-hydroxy-2-oxoglutarate aldolase
MAKKRSKSEVAAQIAAERVVAVIRLADASKLVPVIEAVAAGGVRCIEITMTVPNAVELIRQVSSTVSDSILIGAGTVTDAATAHAVIEAGAQFVVSPILSPEVIAACKQADIYCAPGCFTPTEIFTAWKLGADVIKVFPATSLGPKYFKDIKGPFPNIPLMPTGGVSIENAHEWIAAGAVAVGIGSDLLDKKAIDEGRYEVLTQRAAQLAANVQ